MANTPETAMRPSSDEPSVIRFYSMVALARLPTRSDRSASGSMPVRAFRYCDAMTLASGLGWTIFPPLDFELLFTDSDIMFMVPSVERKWRRLDKAAFPDLAERYNAYAPKSMLDGAPPFLTAIGEPGIVQIWTGLFVRTAEGWASNLKVPANVPRPGGFQQYEGIVETARWFGPLFTNVRLTRTDVPVQFSTALPLIQLVPIPVGVYSDKAQNAAAGGVIALPDWSGDDWGDYDSAVLHPSREPNRQVGGYAVKARRLRAKRCPMHASIRQR